MAQTDSGLRARQDQKSNGGDPSVISTSLEPEQDATTISTTISHDRHTLTWSEIPKWQRDNDYILTGYRRVQYSWRGCAYSIFGYLHNETVNIQTHLFGAVLFAVLLSTFQQVYFIHYESTNWLDSTVFTIFLTATVFCLLSSSCYHTFSVHSKEMSSRCHAVDYAGIMVLIVGSFFPCIYYEFYCDTALQMLYLSLIVLIGTGAAYIVLDPEYTKPSHRGARTKVFIALGLSAIIPVGHGFVTHGLQKVWSEMGFWWLIASGLLYIAGALLYANRIPERFSPGTFDHFFASHQIFHVCVVLAALATYACVLTAFDHAHSRIGYCSS